MTVEAFDSDIHDALNVVGNHEPKLAAYVGLQQLGELSHSGINQRLGTHYGLPEFNLAGNVEGSFVSHGFSVVRMAESVHRNHMVRHFSTRREESAMPVVGEMYEWSSGTTLSLATVLGKTHSNSKVGSHAPFNSYTILRAALETEPINSYGRSISELLTRADTMADHGIIRRDEEVNRFSINDPDYRGDRPFQSLKPETQILYSTLRVAKDMSPSRRWTVEELLGLSEVFFDDPSDDALKEKVRKNLAMAASKGKPRSFKGTIDKIYFRYGYYEVEGAYFDTVSDLVERVTKLGEDNTSFRDQATDKAVAMHESGTLAGLVIMKGFKKFSDDGHD